MLIDREADILFRQGLIEPPPPELEEAGGEYEIKFDNEITRMMQADEAAGGMRTLETAKAYAAETGDTSVLDNFDIDGMYRDMSKINGMPEKWLRSIESVVSIREAKAEQAQQMQEQENLPNVARMADSAAKLQKGAA